jgi:hypothetical protein
MVIGVQHFTAANISWIFTRFSELKFQFIVCLSDRENGSTISLRNGQLAFSGYTAAHPRDQIICDRLCGLVVRVLFTALPDFLRSNGSGTRFTQPREYNWGATWKKKYRLRSKNPRIWPWESVTLTTLHLCLQKLALTSLWSGARSVGIVRLRFQATEVF